MSIGTSNKVPATWGDTVRVVIGEMSDARAIGEAVKGSDVVVSALGPSMDRKATSLPLVEGTRHILDAMERHSITATSGTETPSILDPQEKPTFQTRLIGFMGRTIFKRAYDELLGMTQPIKSSGVDWSIVRFSAPKDRPMQGNLRVGFYGNDKTGFPVSRADIAAFTAAQVDDTA